ncbi:hypothetical protein AAG906_029822 [Vitis piasezkii]
MPLQLLFVASLLPFISAARRLAQDQQPLLLQYHNGPSFRKISINLIWYGKFKPSQRAIVSDFITSLSSSKTTPHQPSVAAWWNTIDKYYLLIKSKKSTSLGLSLGTQILDENYSLGKSLTSRNLKQLAAKGQQSNAINPLKGSAPAGAEHMGLLPAPRLLRLMARSPSSHTSGWVTRDSVPRSMRMAIPPAHLRTPESTLSAPNNDVGMEGIVMNLASLLAGTVTNPFGNGYYQGSAEAPLEAASACPGIYGKGAYPGYAGKLLEDHTTGASYNANGVNGRKYLLPALLDPSTSTCSTLV